MTDRTVVYATSTAQVRTPDGALALIRHGSHWFADDPVVAANPDMFSSDPRYGLSWTGEPPPEMRLPPDVPVEQATAAPGERRQVRKDEQRG